MTALLTGVAMTQNIYDNAAFFEGYATLDRSVKGPDAEQIAQNPALAEEKERPMIFLLAARKPLI